MIKVALLECKSGTIGVQKWRYCNVKGLVLNRRLWCVMLVNNVTCCV